MLVSGIQKTHLKDIIQLSDQVFGKDFLDTAYISSHINSSKHMGYVLLSGKKEVMGYILVDLLSPCELSATVVNENTWFLNYFKPFNKIALIKQIVVSPVYQNKGLGSFLIDHIQNKLSDLANAYCCIVWKKEGDNSLKYILLKNKFKPEKITKNYWSNDSVDKNYNCAVCGSPPCKCCAEIYTKKGL